MRASLGGAMVGLSAGFLIFSLLPKVVIMAQCRQIPTFRLDFPWLWMDFDDGFLGGAAYQISLTPVSVGVTTLIISTVYFWLCEK